MEHTKTEIRVECGCGAVFTIVTAYQSDAREAAIEFYTHHSCAEKKQPLP